MVIEAGRREKEKARKKKREKSAAGTTYFHRANGAAAVFTPLKRTHNSRMLEIFMMRVSFLKGKEGKDSVLFARYLLTR